MSLISSLTDIDVLRTALHWVQAGHQVILATVIHTWGSAPRKAGAHMTIRDDSVFVGSISGGCVEGAVIQTVLAGFDGIGQEVSFGVSTEAAWEVGLSCGGEIRVWLEYLNEAILLSVLSKIDNRIVCALYFSLDGLQRMSVQTSWTAENSFKSILSSDGNALRIYSPSRRVFVIGAVHIAQIFSVMAKQVGYEVVIIDPRGVFIQSERWQETRRISLYPDECLVQENLGERDALIALSHDPKIDDPALEMALKAKVFYLGALGSRKNHAKRCQRLIDLGYSSDEVSRIHGPIGLNIGSKTPAEIAVSILAELISQQRNR